FNKIKPPYNINQATQELALKALDNVEQVNEWIRETVTERDILSAKLTSLAFVQRVYPSDANFILAKTIEPRDIYNYLVKRGIIVRDRSKVELCEGCLRITVGTPDENKTLLSTLEEYGHSQQQDGSPFAYEQ